jgi:fatty acid-binding protein DegV
MEDVNEDGEGVSVPVIREKKKAVEKITSKVRVMTDEHKAKMQEAGRIAREAKKAAQGEKKEMKALVKEPEMPSKSAAKKMCFCNCPSCPHK